MKGKQSEIWHRLEFLKDMVKEGDFGKDDNLNKEDLEKAFDTYVTYDLPEPEMPERLAFPLTKEKSDET